MTPWTRLEGTELWNAAAAAYNANGHAYHSFHGHIESMYSHAERLGMDYDLSLDRAILAHDVVLDHHGNNERRSADWLEVHLEEEDAKARELILTTIDHRPSHPDNRLALLDLAGFIRPEERRHNTRLLRDEAQRNAGLNFDQVAWVKGTLTYLVGLHERITTDLPGLDERGQYLWGRIAKGISSTCATMPLVYAPHPAQGIERFTRGGETVLQAIVAAGKASSEMMNDIIPEPISDREELLRKLVGLEEAGMVRRTTPPRGLPRDWEPTEEGRDWVARMIAPHENFPEPDYADGPQ